ncbi:hypothetical protein M138_4769 [Bacteroides fragilis str. S23L17]|nr:hypothetical protein M138_4769 [Bacteroides fragilis str. S23L17]
MGFCVGSACVGLGLEHERDFQLQPLPAVGQVFRYAGREQGAAKQQRPCLVYVSSYIFHRHLYHSVFFFSGKRSVPGGTLRSV